MSNRTNGRDDTQLRIVGHPSASIGMGEHVRSVWRAFNEVGMAPQMVEIHTPTIVSDPDVRLEFSNFSTDRLGNGINIFCINADEVARALKVLEHRNAMAVGSYNIIYPAWELERYPAEWGEHLNRFNEVWTATTFVQDSISEAVGIPTYCMRLGCEVRKRALVSRRRYNIRESAYAFLFAFDFLSYVSRKNPFAVIDAFRSLLVDRPFDDVVLIIKTSNAERRPEMKAEFDAAVETLSDRVVVINETLSNNEMKSLMYLTDCFVSLHRSEGFGFGIAEAMALAKPVIVTAYSGNMDYCSDDTALLIPYELVALQPGQYPHWENQRWAEPDVDAARRAMIALIDDPDQGRMLGRQARRKMASDWSYLSVGSGYSDRVNNILGAMSS